jgi:hypothetical protein
MRACYRWLGRSCQSARRLNPPRRAELSLIPQVAINSLALPGDQISPARRARREPQRPAIILAHAIVVRTSPAQGGVGA